MDTIGRLFFHLTPTTLAAIVADLSGTTLWREVAAAVNIGVDNCGAEEFGAYLAEARAAAGITITDDDNGLAPSVLAQQGW